MKKFCLFFCLLIFYFSYSQNAVNTDLKALKAFVEKTYKENPKAVKGYVVNAENGKMYEVKTDDPFVEFKFEFHNVYEIIRRNEKVVFTRKDVFSDDSGESYRYYFDEKGRLMGAEKNVSSFYGNEKVVYYSVEYSLSKETDKLERVKEAYTDENDKEIKKDSKEYRLIMQSDLPYFIENLDKITFRDLEGFMKAENLKYYR